MIRCYSCSTVTFSEKPTTIRPGLVACLAVSICILVSVICCGIGRLEFATADTATATLQTANVDDAERPDLESASPPTVHKTFDVIAQNHRALPHRMRSLTPWRWWHLGLPIRHPGDIADPGDLDVSATGRKLLTQFCISLR